MNRLFFYLIVLSLTSGQLLLAQGDTELWGISTLGFNGNGGIFKMDEHGENYQVVHAFEGNSFTGAINTQFIEVNGKLYAAASGGGVFQKGGLYSYDLSTKKIEVLYNFHYAEGEQSGPLVQLGQKLYGLTHRDGSTIYSYDLSNDSFQTEYSFDEQVTGFPYSDGLTLLNGKFYGVSGQWLTSNPAGHIFEFDPVTGNYQQLRQFNDSSMGAYGIGHLVLGPNNVFYGMTNALGDHGFGTIYSYDVAIDSFTVHHHFDGLNGGKPSSTSLLYDGQDKLYGLTSRHGQHDMGTFFEYSLKNEQYTVIHQFQSALGLVPYGNLCWDAQNKLIGTTSGGGAHGDGTTFAYDTSNQSFVKVFDFSFSTSGDFSSDSYILASDGKLYSAIASGTPGGNGSVYSVGSSGNPINQAFFKDRSKGFFPEGQLLHHSNGRLYGIARGGEHEDGILFSIHPDTEAFKIEHHFEESEGYSATGFLCESPQGSIYGLNRSGGLPKEYFEGNIWKYNVSNAQFDTITQLNKNTTGNQPTGGFTLAPNGKLYAAIGSESKNQKGSIIEVDPSTDQVRVVVYLDDLDGAISNANGTMVKYSNGMMYGIALKASANNEFSIFQFNSYSHEVKTVFDFPSASTVNVSPSNLSRGPNNKLYGKHSSDDDKNGLLYSFDIENNAYEVLVRNVDPEDGAINNRQALTWASNGKLYGLTSHLGTDNFGSVLAFDVDQKDHEVKVYFNGYNGGKSNAVLTEVNGDPLVVEQNISNIHLQIFPNPASQEINIHTDIREPGITTIYNALGEVVTSLHISDLSTFQLDIHQLPIGIYLLHLESGQFSHSLQFIKH